MPARPAKPARPSVDDALALAERFASEASLRTGQPWRGFVEEFEQGWAVWAAPPAGQRPMIGAGKTVLDRETGAVTQWPSWPTETLATEYASHHTVKTPASPFPGVLPLLSRERWIESPDGRVWRASSWLAESPPEHHPLVAQWLSTQARLVRGVERHAELLVLSAALHDLDWASLRECSSQGHPCDSCTRAYVHFGLLGPAALEFITPTQPTDLITKVPDFNDGNAFEPSYWARFAFELLEPVFAPVEAARAAIERYPVAISRFRGPGAHLWVRPFRLGVTRALASHAPALTGFSELLEAVLYPLGVEERGDGVITIDGHGRLFVLDQAGAWFLGDNIEAALATLIEGHAAPRQPLTTTS